MDLRKKASTGKIDASITPGVHALNRLTVNDKELLKVVWKFAKFHIYLIHYWLMRNSRQRHSCRGRAKIYSYMLFVYGVSTQLLPTILGSKFYHNGRYTYKATAEPQLPSILSKNVYRSIYVRRCSTLTHLTQGRVNTFKSQSLLLLRVMQKVRR